MQNFKLCLSDSYGPPVSFSHLPVLSLYCGISQQLSRVIPFVYARIFFSGCLRNLVDMRVKEP